MAQRAIPTTIGPVHGLSPNLYAAAASSAYVDLANYREVLFLFNLLSVSAAAGQIVLQDSPDASVWTDVGTIDVSTGVYNATLEARMREEDVERYVRARFLPGGGGSITGSCNIIAFMPRAENLLAPVFAFDSANL